MEAVKEQMEDKGKAWSHGTSWRLPFGVNVNLNLSNNEYGYDNVNNKNNDNDHYYDIALKINARMPGDQLWKTFNDSVRNRIKSVVNLHLLNCLIVMLDARWQRWTRGARS